MAAGTLLGMFGTPDVYVFSSKSCLMMQGGALRARTGLEVLVISASGSCHNRQGIMDH